jgi:RND family efflux transporter MFP subunit
MERLMQVEQVPPVLTRRKLRFWGCVAVLAAAAVVANGLIGRRTADATLQSWTDQQATPTVTVAAPDAHVTPATLSLPGRLEAYSQAQIFARVPGYVKDWKFDIGASVKAGQVLAEIDAPDLDQQIMQAQADLANAQANDVLSRVTLQRGNFLIPSGSISKEVLDQRAADYQSKEALLKAAQANLDRLLVLAKYKQVVAPFDGIVTSRTTDVGALINAGSSAGQALFVISDVSKLRVYVDVPQSYVPRVKMGAQARLLLPEYPRRSFPATVEASTRTVDPGSGATRIQLVVDNSKNELMAGGYATVSLDLSGPSTAIEIPASALIFDQNGLRVATVDSQDRIVLKRVTVARDLGQVIEIGSGLTLADRIVVNPPDGAAAGDRVRVANGATAPGGKEETVARGS